MNYKQLIQVLDLLPQEADEIIVKGRETTEVFFTMPKEWTPPTQVEDSEGSGIYNPAATPIIYKGQRWRLVLT